MHVGRGWRLVSLVLVLILAVGCASPTTDEDGALAGRLKVAGSTAMLPLAAYAAEQFMDLHPLVQMQVSGGGSFTGLAQVSAGAIDIGNSDVPAPADRYGDLIGTQVARAPFVFITHPALTVEDLSREQLVGIFTGAITNWREVGGPDAPITLIHRPSSSGSRAAIKEVVLGGQEFTANATTQDSNGRVRAAIATTPNAIGYIDASYIDPKMVKVLRYNGVAYSPENVLSGAYPVYVHVWMYTKGQAGPLAQAFLDHVLSDHFQSTVLPELGFVSVK